MDYEKQRLQEGQSHITVGDLVRQASGYNLF